MKRIFAVVAAGAALGALASPVFAGNFLQAGPSAGAAPQQAQAPARPQKPAAGAAGTTVAQQQAPAPAQPQPAQGGGQQQQAAQQKPDLSESSGEWLLQCWKQPVKTCQLLQRRIEAKSKQQLLLAAIGVRADGVHRMTMITPLGFKSTPTLTVFADKAPFVQLPVQSCLPAGCVQIGDLTDPLVTKLQGASEMSIVLQGLNGQNFNLSIPTKGLKEGLARISQFLKS